MGDGKMQLTLTRSTLAPATLGRLSVDGVEHSDTLERPWLDNARRESCIPEGMFSVTIRYSQRFSRLMLHVENVPGRDGILIHAANQVSELQGCIALGKRLSADTLLDSKRAVMDLEGKVRGALARGEAVQITISNPVVA